MAEEPDNIVLEHLRLLREGQRRIEEKMDKILIRLEVAPV